MSIPVSLLELPEVSASFGPTPYILTVGPDHAPRATSVAVEWAGDVLVAGAGRRVAANVEQNDQVTLLWPAPAPGGHALIVDGWADLRRPPAGGLELVIRPASAILHVTRRVSAEPGPDADQAPPAGEPERGAEVAGP
ncbi:MAG: pyridoxamine 5'-phosphate oxidase family protein [Actinomycetota bacterium]